MLVFSERADSALNQGTVSPSLHIYLSFTSTRYQSQSDYFKYHNLWVTIGKGIFKMKIIGQSIWHWKLKSQNFLYHMPLKETFGHWQASFWWRQSQNSGLWAPSQGPSGHHTAFPEWPSCRTGDQHAFPVKAHEINNVGFAGPEVLMQLLISAIEWNQSTGN